MQRLRQAPFAFGSELITRAAFKGIDDAKRPIEPARVILAFEVRPGQQLCSGFCAGAEHVAYAVDRSGEPGFRKLLG